MAKDQKTQALRKRAQQEQRERETKVGEVVIYFREKQVESWGDKEEYYMRAYSRARAEIRSTANTTFLTVIQTTDQGRVEHMLDWSDIRKVVSIPALGDAS